jgi:Fungal Zn(2)-Cys(6) binuclear cluster domain.
MSKPFRSAAGKLPKSVKVRSTCNACQQAKIRCSHEKPSCRRCQKHKVDCIYSVSRRLGRPAKKKTTRLGLEGQGGAPSPDMVDQQERLKPASKSRKKKNRGQIPGSGMSPSVGRASANTSQDKFQSSPGPEKNGDDISGESSFFANGFIYYKGSLIVSTASRFRN